MTELDSLNQQFAIPGHVDFVAGPGGLIQASINNGLASAEILLQGAQVIGWQAGHAAPVIWLSKGARFEAGKAIRGGIPICWPWFGPHPETPALPAHGFARTAFWEVAHTEAFPNGATCIDFKLQASASTLALWPHEFELHYRVTVSQTLTLELLTHNPGNSAFTITEALHTYFAVGDIGDITIDGLAGCAYVDKVDQEKTKIERGNVQIDSETDRVYLDTPGEFNITDPRLKRRIHVHAEDSYSTVVWNPWQIKSEKMGDMGQDGYRTMVCMEGGNAYNNAVTVPSGQTHRLSTTYSIADQL